jgi:hypothetical protein
MYFGCVARCMKINVRADEVVSLPALIMRRDSP